MSYGRDSGGGLKGMMMLSMVFVFGAAAYLAARDFESDLCGQFYGNINVVRRVGDVKECGVAPGPSIDARDIVLRIRGGAGEALISIERKARVVTRAYLTTRANHEPELVLGSDPMVSSSRILTR